MRNKITYGQLFEKLRQLGFVDEPLQCIGSSRHYFKHPRVKNVSVILPMEAEDETAAPLHVLWVRSMLVAHGLVDENDFVQA